MGGVDELHLPRAVGGLVLVQHPDISADAGVHKHIGAHLHDGVQPVVFQNVAADLAGAAARVAGEQGRAVLNDRHFAAVGQLCEPVEHKELLPVGYFGQAGRKAAQLALLVLGLHGLLLPLPVDAEGRVGDDVLEGVAGELILGQGIAEAHVVGISAADHHVCLGNGEGGGVEFLPEAGDFHIGVQIVNALLHAGKHLARAHGHIIDRDVARFRQVGVGQQQVGFARQRDGNHHALLHAAGKLMGIFTEAVPRNADHFQHFLGPLLRLRLRAVVMQRDDFSDLLANPHRWVQRGHRILEDHGNPLSPNLPHVFFSQVQQVLPFQLHGSRGDPGRAVRQDLQN